MPINQAKKQIILFPTILIPFRKRNIKYRYFKINKNLEIDIKDLKSKINKNTKAVFFINYFGFSSKKATISFLKEIKEEKIILIEDSVQSFFSDIELIGDYSFNSFRKILPIDGSVIISNNKIKTTQKSKSFTTYFFLKSIGQDLRMLSNKFQILDLSNLFLNLFSLANKEYYKYTDINFNWWNKYILSKYGIEALKEKRLNNYKILLENFESIALFEKIENNIIPLGFPILVTNRDLFRRKLISKNMFCPIHWKLSDEIDKKEFKESWYMSENILTLPINENVSNVELNYLIQKVKELYESLSQSIRIRRLHSN